MNQREGDYPWAAENRKRLADAYRERVRVAHARVQELELKKSWIARKIRRTRPHVSAVLHGRNRGPGTLYLIEELIRQVEAGTVIPR